MTPDPVPQICQVLNKLVPDLRPCYHKTYSDQRYISTAFTSKTFGFHIVVDPKAYTNSTEVSITSGEFNPDLPFVQASKKKALEILQSLKTLFPKSESETYWDDGTAHRTVRIPNP